jgi:hypothetical protein
MTVKLTYEALIAYVHSLQAICTYVAGRSVKVASRLNNVSVQSMYIMYVCNTYVRLIRLLSNACAYVLCQICRVPRLCCVFMSVCTYLSYVRLVHVYVRTHLCTMCMYARFVSSSLSALC